MSEKVMSENVWGFQKTEDPQRSAESFVKVIDLIVLSSDSASICSASDTNAAVDMPYPAALEELHESQNQMCSSPIILRIKAEPLDNNTVSGNYFTEKIESGNETIYINVPDPLSTEKMLSDSASQNSSSFCRNSTVPAPTPFLGIPIDSRNTPETSSGLDHWRIKEQFNSNYYAPTCEDLKVTVTNASVDIHHRHVLHAVERFKQSPNQMCSFPTMIPTIKTEPRDGDGNILKKIRLNVDDLLSTKNAFSNPISNNSGPFLMNSIIQPCSGSLVPAADHLLSIPAVSENTPEMSSDFDISIKEHFKGHSRGTPDFGDSMRTDSNATASMLYSPVLRTSERLNRSESPNESPNPMCSTTIIRAIQTEPLHGKGPEKESASRNETNCGDIDDSYSSKRDTKDVFLKRKRLCDESSYHTNDSHEQVRKRIQIESTMTDRSRVNSTWDQLTQNFSIDSAKYILLNTNFEKKDVSDCLNQISSYTSKDSFEVFYDEEKNMQIGEPEVEIIESDSVQILSDGSFEDNPKRREFNSSEQESNICDTTSGKDKYIRIVAWLNTVRSEELSSNSTYSEAKDEKSSYESNNTLNAEGTSIISNEELQDILHNVTLIKNSINVTDETEDATGHIDRKPETPFVDPTYNIQINQEISQIENDTSEKILICETYSESFTGKDDTLHVSNMKRLPTEISIVANGSSMHSTSTVLENVDDLKKPRNSFIVPTQNSLINQDNMNEIANEISNRILTYENNFEAFNDKNACNVSGLPSHVSNIEMFVPETSTFTNDSLKTLSGVPEKTDVDKKLENSFIGPTHSAINENNVDQIANEIANKISIYASDFEAFPIKIENEVSGLSSQVSNMRIFPTEISTSVNDLSMTSNDESEETEKVEKKPQNSFVVSTHNSSINQDGISHITNEIANSILIDESDFEPLADNNENSVPNRPSHVSDVKIFPEERIAAANDSLRASSVLPQNFEDIEKKRKNPSVVSARSSSIDQDNVSQIADDISNGIMIDESNFEALADNNENSVSSRPSHVSDIKILSVEMLTAVNDSLMVSSALPRNVEDVEKGRENPAVVSTRDSSTDQENVSQIAYDKSSGIFEAFVDNNKNSVPSIPSHMSDIKILSVEMITAAKDSLMASSVLPQNEDIEKKLGNPSVVSTRSSSMDQNNVSQMTNEISNGIMTNESNFEAFADNNENSVSSILSHVNDIKIFPVEMETDAKELIKDLNIVPEKSKYVDNKSENSFIASTQNLSINQDNIIQIANEITKRILIYKSNFKTYTNKSEMFGIPTEVSNMKIMPSDASFSDRDALMTSTIVPDRTENVGYKPEYYPLLQTPNTSMNQDITSQLASEIYSKILSYEGNLEAFTNKDEKAGPVLPSHVSNKKVSPKISTSTSDSLTFTANVPEKATVVDRKNENSFIAPICKELINNTNEISSEIPNKISINESSFENLNDNSESSKTGLSPHLSNMKIFSSDISNAASDLLMTTINSPEKVTENSGYSLIVPSENASTNEDIMSQIANEISSRISSFENIEDFNDKNDSLVSRLSCNGSSTIFSPEILTSVNNSKRASADVPVKTDTNDWKYKNFTIFPTNSETINQDNISQITSKISNRNFSYESNLKASNNETAFCGITSHLSSMAMLPSDISTAANDSSATSTYVPDGTGNVDDKPESVVPNFNVSMNPYIISQIPNEMCNNISTYESNFETINNDNETAFCDIPSHLSNMTILPSKDSSTASTYVPDETENVGDKPESVAPSFNASINPYITSQIPNEMCNKTSIYESNFEAFNNKNETAFCDIPSHLSNMVILPSNISIVSNDSLTASTYIPDENENVDDKPESVVPRFHAPINPYITSQIPNEICNKTSTCESDFEAFNNKNYGMPSHLSNMEILTSNISIAPNHSLMTSTYVPYGAQNIDGMPKYPSVIPVHNAWINPYISNEIQYGIPSRAHENNFEAFNDMNARAFYMYSRQYQQAMYEQNSRQYQQAIYGQISQQYQAVYEQHSQQLLGNTFHSAIPISYDWKQNDNNVENPATARNFRRVVPYDPRLSKTVTSSDSGCISNSCPSTSGSLNLLVSTQIAQPSLPPSDLLPQRSSVTSSVSSKNASYIEDNTSAIFLHPKATSSDLPKSVVPDPRENRVMLFKRVCKKIGKRFVSTNDMYSIFIGWKAYWLDTQKNVNLCPFICEQYAEMKDSYETTVEYYNTFFPRHLLSIWLEMYESWNQSLGLTYDVKIESCEERAYHVKSVYSMISSSDDFVMCDGIYLVDPKTDITRDKLLGHVYGIKVYKCHEYPKERGNSRIKVKCSCYTAEKPNVRVDKHIKLQKLCNVRMPLMQNQALMNLEVCTRKELILNPKDCVSKIHVVTISSCDDKVALKECIDSVVNYTMLSDNHITIVDTPSAVGRLPALLKLAIGIVERGSTVLVCLKTKDVLFELAAHLPTKDLALAIKETEIRVPERFRKVLLRARAIQQNRTEAYVLERCKFILTVLSNIYLSCSGNAFESSILTCIIDGANLCTEVETSLPLSMNPEYVVMVGDSVKHADVHPHLQRYGYQKSLYNRLISAYRDDEIEKL